MSRSLIFTFSTSLFHLSESSATMIGHNHSKQCSHRSKELVPENHGTHRQPTHMTRPGLTLATLPAVLQSWLTLMSNKGVDQ